MPIVMDSSQWTGEYDDKSEPYPVVWGEFADQDTLDQVTQRLKAEDWFRQSVQQVEAHRNEAANNDQVITPDENPKDADQRSLRQNFVGATTASTAMLAAGVVIATGGAALPAAVAAAAAGAATAAVGEVAGNALQPSGTGRRPESQDAAMQTAGLALGIHALTDEVRTQAEAFLQQQGASRTWVQEQQAV